MIEAYVRDENDFSLFRLYGKVSIAEIKDAVTNAMNRNNNSPFAPVALIDTRPLEEYDARFLQSISFAEWLRSVFAKSGYELRIIMLTREAWIYGMAHMFAMAANATGCIHVTLCNTEDDLIQRCNAANRTLADLFQPEQLVYISKVATEPPQHQ